MDSDEEMARARLGEVLHGRWKLETLLGVGGMAAVYGATDGEGRAAAIKVLHPEMSRRPDMRERFFREGQVANRVGHRGVVRIEQTALADEQTAILVMELLEGKPLSALIEQLKTDDLLDVLDQVLDVLARAHDQGIVHRDLKPDNLFMTKSGEIKVLDFGIARLLDDVPSSHKTKTGIALGTVPYMAPEQALAKRRLIDGRTDLFSVGALAFRILAGRNVHEAETETELLIAMASKPAPALRTVAPDVPAPIAAIVDVALAFSKDSRYPDARTMQEDVRAVRAGASPPFASAALQRREQATNPDLVAPELAEAAGAKGSETPRPASTLELADTVESKAAATVEPGSSFRGRQRARLRGRAKGRRGIWLGGVAAVSLAAGAVLALGVMRGEDGSDAERSLPAKAAQPESKAAAVPPVGADNDERETDGGARVQEIGSASSAARTGDGSPRVGTAETEAIETEPSDKSPAAERDPGAPKPAAAPGSTDRVTPEPGGEQPGAPTGVEAPSETSPERKKATPPSDPGARGRGRGPSHPPSQR